MSFPGGSRTVATTAADAAATAGDDNNADDEFIVDSTKYETRKIGKLRRERECIQAKTYRNWINSVLIRAHTSIIDIYTDLSSGENLLALLELITGKQIAKPNKGSSYLHKIENVSKCLKFIKANNVYLESIGPEDIVNGNEKLILGLVWTIILRFQLSQHFECDKKDIKSVRDSLLLWCQLKTKNSDKVKIKDFNKSWRSGWSFVELIDSLHPGLIDRRQLKGWKNTKILNHCFEVAERYLNIPKILDAKDVDNSPDDNSVLTYVSYFYNLYTKTKTMESRQHRIEHFIEENRKIDTLEDSFRNDANRLLKLIQGKRESFQGEVPLHKANKVMLDFQQYFQAERANISQLRNDCTTKYFELRTKKSLLRRHRSTSPNRDLLGRINQAWSELEECESQRSRYLKDRIAEQRRLTKQADLLNTKIIKIEQYIANKFETINRIVKHDRCESFGPFLQQSELACQDILTNRVDLDSLNQTLQQLKESNFQDCSLMEMPLRQINMKIELLKNLASNNLQNIEITKRLFSYKNQLNVVKEEVSKLKKTIETSPTTEFETSQIVLMQAENMKQHQHLLTILDRQYLDIESMVHLLTDNNNQNKLLNVFINTSQLSEQLSEVKQMITQCDHLVKDNLNKCGHNLELNQFIEDINFVDKFLDEKQTLCLTLEDISYHAHNIVYTQRRNNITKLEIKTMEARLGETFRKGYQLRSQCPQYSAQVMRSIETIRTKWKQTLHMVNERTMLIQDTTKLFQLCQESNYLEQLLTTISKHDLHSLLRSDADTYRTELLQLHDILRQISQLSITFHKDANNGKSIVHLKKHDFGSIDLSKSHAYLATSIEHPLLHFQAIHENVLRLATHNIDHIIELKHMTKLDFERSQLANLMLTTNLDHVGQLSNSSPLCHHDLSIEDIDTITKIFFDEDSEVSKLNEFFHSLNRRQRVVQTDLNDMDRLISFTRQTINLMNVTQSFIKAAAEKRETETQVEDTQISEPDETCDDNMQTPTKEFKFKLDPNAANFKVVVYKIKHHADLLETLLTKSNDHHGEVDEMASLKFNINFSKNIVMNSVRQLETLLEDNEGDTTKDILQELVNEVVEQQTKVESRVNIMNFVQNIKEFMDNLVDQSIELTSLEYGNKRTTITSSLNTIKRINISIQSQMAQLQSDYTTLIAATTSDTDKELIEHRMSSLGRSFTQVESLLQQKIKMFNQEFEKELIKLSTNVAVKEDVLLERIETCLFELQHNMHVPHYQYQQLLEDIDQHQQYSSYKPQLIEVWRQKEEQEMKVRFDEMFAETSEEVSKDLAQLNRFLEQLSPGDNVENENMNKSIKRKLISHNLSYKTMCSIAEELTSNEVSSALAQFKQQIEQIKLQEDRLERLLEVHRSIDDNVTKELTTLRGDIGECNKAKELDVIVNKITKINETIDKLYRDHSNETSIQTQLDMNRIEVSNVMMEVKRKHIQMKCEEKLKEMRNLETQVPGEYLPIFNEIKQTLESFGDTKFAINQQVLDNWQTIFTQIDSLKKAIGEAHMQQTMKEASTSRAKIGSLGDLSIKEDNPILSDHNSVITNSSNSLYYSEADSGHCDGHSMGTTPDCRISSHDRLSNDYIEESSDTEPLRSVSEENLCANKDDNADKFTSHSNLSLIPASIAGPSKNASTVELENLIESDPLLYEVSCMFDNKYITITARIETIYKQVMQIINNDNTNNLATLLNEQSDAIQNISNFIKQNANNTRNYRATPAADMSEVLKRLNLQPQELEHSANNQLAMFHDKSENIFQHLLQYEKQLELISIDITSVVNKQDTQTVHIEEVHDIDKPENATAIESEASPETKDEVDEHTSPTNINKAKSKKKKKKKKQKHPQNYANVSTYLGTADDEGKVGADISKVPPTEDVISSKEENLIYDNETNKEDTLETSDNIVNLIDQQKQHVDNLTTEADLVDQTTSEETSANKDKSKKKKNKKDKKKKKQLKNANVHESQVDHESVFRDEANKDLDIVEGDGERNIDANKDLQEENKQDIPDENDESNKNETLNVNDGDTKLDNLSEQTIVEEHKQPEESNANMAPEEGLEQAREDVSQSEPTIEEQVEVEQIESTLVGSNEQPAPIEKSKKKKKKKNKKKAMVSPRDQQNDIDNTIERLDYHSPAINTEHEGQSSEDKSKHEVSVQMKPTIVETQVGGENADTEDDKHSIQNELAAEDNLLNDGEQLKDNILMTKSSDNEQTTPSQHVSDINVESDDNGQVLSTADNTLPPNEHEVSTLQAREDELETAPMEDEQTIHGQQYLDETLEQDDLVLKETSQTEPNYEDTNVGNEKDDHSIERELDDVEDTPRDGEKQLMSPTRKEHGQSSTLNEPKSFGELDEAHLVSPSSDNDNKEATVSNQDLQQTIPPASQDEGKQLDDINVFGEDENTASAQGQQLLQPENEDHDKQHGDIVVVCEDADILSKDDQQHLIPPTSIHQDKQLGDINVVREEVETLSTDDQQHLIPPTSELQDKQFGDIDVVREETETLSEDDQQHSIPPTSVHQDKQPDEITVDSQNEDIASGQDDQKLIPSTSEDLGKKLDDIHLDGEDIPSIQNATLDTIDNTTTQFHLPDVLEQHDHKENESATTDENVEHRNEATVSPENELLNQTLDSSVDNVQGDELLEEISQQDSEDVSHLPSPNNKEGESVPNQSEQIIVTESTPQILKKSKKKKKNKKKNKKVKADQHGEPSAETTELQVDDKEGEPAHTTEGRELIEDILDGIQGDQEIETKNLVSPEDEVCKARDKSPEWSTDEVEGMVQSDNNHEEEIEISNNTHHEVDIEENIPSINEDNSLLVDKVSQLEQQLTDVCNELLSTLQTLEIHLISKETKEKETLQTETTTITPMATTMTTTLETTSPMTTTMTTLETTSPITTTMTTLETTSPMTTTMTTAIEATSPNESEEIEKMQQVDESNEIENEFGLNMKLRIDQVENNLREVQLNLLHSLELIENKIMQRQVDKETEEDKISDDMSNQTEESILEDENEDLNWQEEVIPSEVIEDALNLQKEQLSRSRSASNSTQQSSTKDTEIVGHTIAPSFQPENIANYLATASSGQQIEENVSTTRRKRKFSDEEDLCDYNVSEEYGHLVKQTKPNHIDIEGRKPFDNKTNDNFEGDRTRTTSMLDTHSDKDDNVRSCHGGDDQFDNANVNVPEELVDEELDLISDLITEQTSSRNDIKSTQLECKPTFSEQIRKIRSKNKKKKKKNNSQPKIKLLTGIKLNLGDTESESEQVDEASKDIADTSKPGMSSPYGEDETNKDMSSITKDEEDNQETHTLEELPEMSALPEEFKSQPTNVEKEIISQNEALEQRHTTSNEISQTEQPTPVSEDENNWKSKENLPSEPLEMSLPEHPPLMPASNEERINIEQLDDETTQASQVQSAKKATQLKPEDGKQAQSKKKNKKKSKKKRGKYFEDHTKKDDEIETSHALDIAAQDGSKKSKEEFDKFDDNQVFLPEYLAETMTSEHLDDNGNEIRKTEETSNKEHKSDQDEFDSKEGFYKLEDETKLSATDINIESSPQEPPDESVESPEISFEEAENVEIHQTQSNNEAFDSKDNETMSEQTSETHTKTTAEGEGHSQQAGQQVHKDIEADEESCPQQTGQQDEEMVSQDETQISPPASMEWSVGEEEEQPTMSTKPEDISKAEDENIEHFQMKEETILSNESLESQISSFNDLVDQPSSPSPQTEKADTVPSSIELEYLDETTAEPSNFELSPDHVISQQQQQLETSQQLKDEENEETIVAPINTEEEYSNENGETMTKLSSFELSPDHLISSTDQLTLPSQEPEAKDDDETKAGPVSIEEEYSNEKEEAMAKLPNFELPPENRIISTENQSTPSQLLPEFEKEPKLLTEPTDFEPSPNDFDGKSSSLPTPPNEEVVPPTIKPIIKKPSRRRSRRAAKKVKFAIEPEDQTLDDNIEMFKNEQLELDESFHIDDHDDYDRSDKEASGMSPTDEHLEGTVPESTSPSLGRICLYSLPIYLLCLLMLLLLYVIPQDEYEFNCLLRNEYGNDLIRRYPNGQPPI